MEWSENTTERFNSPVVVKNKTNKKNIKFPVKVTGDFKYGRQSVLLWWLPVDVSHLNGKVTE